ncbi:iron-dependent peroxidase [Aliiroseovarius zhejiangensis]|uniref:Iron-dependent peroxidase n=1 Tax=Aliiroseovarius zhejiangensis TaxID=1632025 RepID=A0ABQ3J886_9RHOB|nr:peroxidase [Aliiroseovarius zhejiangensis]GHF03651.1 iron-dependent peroxidase [Aliiroseovarius zhejiangensis]
MTRTQGIPNQPVAFDDMQGLIRFGHGALVEAAFILCRIRDPKAAGAWLETAPVTSAETLPAPPDMALQVAFTAAGLRAMGLGADVLAYFAQPFLFGMTGEDSRSRRLGDTGTNAPENWDWDEAEAHVLILLYARKGGLAAWQDKILTPTFHAAFTPMHTFPTRPNDGFEPFGFRDGISEPKIDWQDARPPAKHGREDFSNLISPGEVVLGYRNEYDERADLSEADLRRNGSYLVMRQLAQDVPGLWTYLDKEADGDSARREELAAQMVGRRRDGTPLIQGRRDVAGSPRKNDFTYDDDVDGLRCPLGAHIRRANPRTGDQPHRGQGRLGWLLSTLGFRRRRDELPGRHDLVASTRFHRLVRRGRAYGSALTPEAALRPDAAKDARGLFFICLCADLVRQFEFVQNAWIAAPTFNGLTGEADPLLGNRQPFCGVASDGFTIQTPTGTGDRFAPLPQFVTVKGGGYFFLPGLSALRIIARHARQEV